MNKTRLFTSKANTLEVLSSEKELNIPSLYTLAAKDWVNNKETILNKIMNFTVQCKQLREGTANQNSFSDLFVVRSSCSREDTNESSGAGAFLSLLNIPIECIVNQTKNIDKVSKANSLTDTSIKNLLSYNTPLQDAINSVFASYGEIEEMDQVLIQPMIQATISGVITTKVLADGSPYYVINYDDESGKTDTVTSGSAGSKTVFIYKEAQESDFDSARLYSFKTFAQTLERICQSDELDIEFCVDNADRICLLQVRPLCINREWIIEAKEKVAGHASFIVDFLEEKMSHQENLFGDYTILGCMPDWNPAEMIGVTPRLLSSSLYRHFITHRVWAIAREKMGYRLTPPDELMILLAGRPFIDVRLSFNSFLPQEISHTTGEILVNAWLDRLNKNPQLHDKIEFEVASTAISFDFEINHKEHYANLLSQKLYTEYKEQLTNLTYKCLDLSQENNSITSAFNAITELSNRQNARENNAFYVKPSGRKIIAKIVALSEECCQLGTLPFSILARHAFIAESFLRSAVSRGALAQETVAKFKNSIQTISGEMSSDFRNVCDGKKSEIFFLNKYGHLRPNTYDILSPSYRERDGLFNISDKQISSTSPANFTDTHKEIFTFTNEEKKSIVSLLQEVNLPTCFNNFEQYIRQSIAGREYAKFIFTKNISDVLSLIESFGKEYEIDKELLSFIDIRDIIEWSSHALLRKPKDYFLEKSQKGQYLFDIGRSLKLSYLIRSHRDIYVVPQHRSTPNFVGSGSIEKEVIVLNAQSQCTEKLDGRIVCIENADPGFDWIFTRQIAGLITKFGGTNSHMAIRCAEYGLPAAIGVGEILFEQISQAEKCMLNIDACVVQARRPLCVQ